MRGLVSVGEDGSNVQLLQSISWQPPVSEEVMLYLIRYGMGVHNPEGASFSVTTINISIELTLSVPGEHPDVLVYNIWVSVLTKSHEQGNTTVLTIQYSSESGLVIIQAIIVHVLQPLLNTYTVIPFNFVHLSTSFTYSTHIDLLLPAPGAPQALQVEAVSCSSI